MDAVVKIDSELLKKIEELVKERKFEYVSNKQVANLAIIEFLNKNKLTKTGKKRANSR